MPAKWHFYASPHIGSVIAYLRIPCSDEAWQFQKKQYSKEVKSQQSNLGVPMTKHPRIFIHKFSYLVLG